MAPSHEHDVVVYGASGFVGRLVAQYLAEHAPAGTRIALAGRSAAKLAAVAADLPGGAAGWPIIVADAADTAALAAMAASTAVVASTVGPYAKYGLPLVAACAEHGTDYVDLTGEVLFVRRCIEQYDAAARASGARIVNACGFDSIPSDLGVYLTHLHAQRTGAGGLGRTVLVVGSVRGGFSGGTIDSLRNQIEEMAGEPAARALVADPFSLSPRRSAARAGEGGGAHGDSLGVSFDRSIGGWTGPFVMAPYNTRIVRRSDELLGDAYGERFAYSEVMGFGSSPLGAVAAGTAAAGMAALTAGMGFGPTRSVLDRVLPAPGEGPDEKTRRNGHFTVRVHSFTDSGAHLRTTVAAKGDPGYQATSMMIGESALCLALDSAALPDRAGVLTPAVAMGEQLAERLRAAGMTLAPETLPR